MKILVTGSAGFIGSNLCENLIKNHYIIGIDDLSVGSLENMKNFNNNSKFEFINARLQEYENLVQIVNSVDIVIHLAASVGILNIYYNPIFAMENNLTSSELIINICTATKKKLIYISSSEIYGKQTESMIKEDTPSVFDNLINIRSTYSIAKITDELKINLLKSKGLESTILRLFNVIGPNQSSKFGMVVPRFLKLTQNNEDITIYGNGEQIRTFCDIRDIVSALDLVINNSNFNGKVYNIGGENEISINTLANLILKNTNSKSQKVYIPYIEIHKEYDEIYYRKPDTTKFANEFEWKAKYSCEDSIKYILECNNLKYA